jgi:hypothetical protein
LTIDNQEYLLEEIKNNHIDASMEYGFLINACSKLKAEKELKTINILNMQNKLNQLTTTYNTVIQRRNIELHNLKQTVKHRQNIIKAHRQRGRMNF